jgi:CheY-like chemotaxis protein
MPDTKKKILVVDDHEPIVKVLTTHLRLEGYEVAAASGGREALLQIEAERPDLVLLDIMMPDFDGRMVLQVIRADPVHRNLPVIMLTALDQDEDIRRTMPLDPDLYLTKPFDPAILRLTIQRVLEMVELRERLEE